MSPRFTFALTAIGVVLAGLPLLSLTGKAGSERVEAAEQPAAGEIPVVLTLRWSGEPAGITLRHAGRALGEVEIGRDAECELECRLPRTPRWEIEVEARWPETQAQCAQAVTLILEPQAQPERAETQWTRPGDTELHNIFTVKGVEL